jgi:MFS family permease
MKLTVQRQHKLLILIVFLLWFSNYSYVPILSTYCSNAGSNLATTGFVIGSYGFSQMLFRIPLGVISDFLKRRKIFLFLGLTLSFLSSLGFLFFTASYMLVLCRAFAGLAVSNWAIYITVFCDVSERNGVEHSMGTLSALMAAGQTVGILAGGIVAQAIGIRWPFIISIIASLIGLGLLLGIEEIKIPVVSKYSLKDFNSVIKDPTLLFFSGLALLLQSIHCSSLTGFLPSILSQAGANNFQKGLGTALATIPTIFAAPFAVNILDRRLNLKYSLLIGFLLLSIPMFFFATLKNIILLLALEIVAGSGRGILFALLMAHSTSHLPSSTCSTAQSAFQAIYGVGMWVGPAITGVISDVYSLQYAFSFLGIIGILGIMLSFLYFKLRPEATVRI